jgi:hypothetical protein
MPKTAAKRFSKTHFYSIVADTWNPYTYSPLREHRSMRAKKAREWYSSATSDSNGIGKSIAKALRALGMPSYHEVTLTTPNGTVRADVLANRKRGAKSEVIVELKAISADATRPSSIVEAVRTTLRRHAVFAGFIQR